MNPYRKLPRSYRRLSKVMLWVLVPLCVVNVALNAALALDDPLRWALAGLWLLAAATFVFAGITNRRTAQNYEAAAAAWDESEKLLEQARDSLAETLQKVEAQQQEHPTGRSTGPSLRFRADQATPDDLSEAIKRQYANIIGQDMPRFDTPSTDSKEQR